MRNSASQKDETQGSQDATSLVDRIASEQVDALFAVVAIGVTAAGIAAVALVAILRRNGVAGGKAGFVWATYIVGCAVAHLLLRHAYRRARPFRHSQWRPWAAAFTLISFAEGVGWGWSTVGLAAGAGFQFELLVLLVTLGIAAGSAPAFGAYLPAFFAIFVPATLPYVAVSLSSSDELEHSSWPLMLIFMAGVIGLGIASDRAMRRAIAVRLRSEQLAKDLQRQKEIAEEASLAKSTFLAAASHDLRQPVHALGLFAGALRGIDLPIEGRRLVERIETSITAIDGLFGALLDMSRLDAGVVEVRRRPFLVGPLLERICRDHGEEARDKGIELLCRPTSRHVDSDPVLVERIVRNLVSNAVRYTDGGRILVASRPRGNSIAIQVWDTGRGVAEDQHGLIFNDYYQLGNVERDRAKGLGLGLAIVRRLTDLLEAPLRLRSTLGKGSCFEIELAAAGADAFSEAVADDDTFSLVASGVIVVVDDEDDIRAAMTQLLTNWGYQAVVASSGDDAIRSLAECPDVPILIVCDYRLRGHETGIDVIERLRSEYNANIPAMLVTGDTAPDRLSEARASGLPLMHKPISNARLRAAIGHLTSHALGKASRQTGE